MYVDESGDHTYQESDDVAKRYLGLTGVVFASEYYRTEFHPRLEDLKQRHFPHSPDEAVVLHRTELVNKNGPFWRLRDPNAEKAWDDDLLRFLTDSRYLLITVVIDKKAHRERYGKAAQHPYHLCMAFLLERYCGLLRFSRDKGDVMAESRGGVEDRALKDAYCHLWREGTFYHSPGFFQDVLTSKQLKLKKKEHNIAGLQVADLLAHPSKLRILAERGRIALPPDTFGSIVAQVVEPKYNRRFGTGEIWGYGKKLVG
jgi:hypothetical protein